MWIVLGGAVLLSIAAWAADEGSKAKDEGWNLYIRGDLTAAENSWRQMEQEARRSGDSPSASEALLLLSMIAEQRGDLSAGISLVEEAARLEAELGQVRPETNRRLAELYARSGRSADAERLLLRAEGSGTAEAREENLGLNMARVAALHAADGDEPRAEAEYLRAIDILPRLTLAEASVLEALSRLYEGQGRYLAASGLCARRIESAKARLGENVAAAETLRDCARLFDLAGRREQARATALEAERLATIPELLPGRVSSPEREGGPGQVVVPIVGRPSAGPESK